MRHAATLVVFLFVALALIAPLTPPAFGRGEDICPEPNDAVQNACFLGPSVGALGFLHRPDDVDVYRFESLDFNAEVRVELRDLPLPYRVSLADWSGTTIGISRDEPGRAILDARLGPPGSYYLLVDSQTGELSDGQLYFINRQLRYASGQSPRILYS